MLIRKRSARSLLVTALAAAPLGANASLVVNPPAVNLPAFNCDSSTGYVKNASYASDSYIKLGDIKAEAADIKLTNGLETQAPISCTDGLFSTGMISGDSFSIDFGLFDSSLLPVGDQIKLDFSSFDQKLFDVGQKIENTVSDFNLFIDVLDVKGDLQVKDFIGVQVISPYGSALSPDSKWYVDGTTGDLIFDPQIPGGSAVINLLTAPETIPEPPSLALLGIGLAGFASVLRRKHST